MNKHMFHLGWVALAVVFCGMGQAKGDIIGVAGGSGNPPATLGGYAMTPFVSTNLPAGQVSSPDIASPLYGSVVLSSTDVGYYPTVAIWGDPWDNSYTGNVYLNESAASLTLTLPSDTSAFYLYIQPNYYAYPDPITVTAQDGTFVTQTVQTNLDGSEYFGFYGTDGDYITTLTISDPLGDEDAFGQFAIAGTESSPTPEPASVALLGIGAVGMVGYAWRRRKKNGSRADGPHAT